MSAPAKRKIRLCLDDISLGVHEVHGPRDSKRAVGAYLNCDLVEILAHVSNPGNLEELVNAMGGATSTWSLTQSGGYAHE